MTALLVRFATKYSWSTGSTKLMSKDVMTSPPSGVMAPERTYGASTAALRIGSAAEHRTVASTEMTARAAVTQPRDRARRPSIARLLRQLVIGASFVLFVVMLRCLHAESTQTPRRPRSSLLRASPFSARKVDSFGEGNPSARGMWLWRV